MPRIDEAIMEWKNKVSIAGVLIFIIFLIFPLSIQLWDDRDYTRIAATITDQNYWWAVCFLIAGSAISVPITLFIVEKVIELDREQQLKKEKIINLKNLLFIITRILDEIIYTLVPSTETKFQIRPIIIAGWKNPNKEVSDKIQEASALIRKSLKEKDEKRSNTIGIAPEDWKKQRDEEIERLSMFFERVSFWLKELRPHILKFNDDYDLYEVLTEFEKEVLLFESMGIYHRQTHGDPEEYIFQQFGKLGEIYEIFRKSYDILRDDQPGK